MNSKKLTIALMICLVMVVGTMAQDSVKASNTSADQHSAHILESININFHNTSWSNYTFPGDGSAAHPYIVQGNLDCSIEHSSQITILNTNAYFTLSVIYPTPIASNDCMINLVNVTHAEILGSYISGQMVYINSSNSLKIENTVFNTSFVTLGEANNSVVEGNTFNSPLFSKSGLKLFGSNNNTIADNTFTNSNDGIVMNQSSNNIIRNNTFVNVNNTYVDYSGTSNVFISAPKSKSTPGLSFEVLTMSLIITVVFRKKITKR